MYSTPTTPTGTGGITGSGGLLAGAIPVVGGLLQGFLGYQGQKKTNEANMELAKYQYSKDLEMWNRGNAYNSPEAQMQRLKAAGLNPNLVYGNGAVGNASGQLPKYNAPTLDYNYVPPVQQTGMNAIGAYQDFQIKQAQINNLREQNKVIRESAEQKRWANMWAGNTIDWRSQSEYNKMYNLSETGALLGTKQANEVLKGYQMSQLLPHQLEYAKGKVRFQDQQIINMIAAEKKINTSTELQQKQIDWFLTKLFGGLAVNAGKEIMKYAMPTKTAGELIKGGKGTFNRTRYNTPGSWKELGY